MPQIAIALAVLVCWSFGLGCEPTSATPAPATAEPPAAPPDPDLDDPLGRRVAKAAQEHAPGWTKLDKLFRGELATRGQQGFLVVLRYGLCYRFVASGGEGVEDLDLALIDAAGVEMQRDVTRDPTPTLGKTVSICPSEPGAFRLDVRMREGQGTFAVGLYRDPE